jgi:hypothetical protein
MTQAQIDAAKDAKIFDKHIKSYWGYKPDPVNDLADYIWCTVRAPQLGFGKMQTFVGSQLKLKGRRKIKAMVAWARLQPTTTTDGEMIKVFPCLKGREKMMEMLRGLFIYDPCV